MLNCSSDPEGPSIFFGRGTAKGTTDSLGCLAAGSLGTATVWGRICGTSSKGNDGAGNGTSSGSLLGTSTLLGLEEQIIRSILIIRF